MREDREHEMREAVDAIAPAVEAWWDPDAEVRDVTAMHQHHRDAGHRSDIQRMGTSMYDGVDPGGAAAAAAAPPGSTPSYIDVPIRWMSLRWPASRWCWCMAVTSRTSASGSHHASTAGAIASTASRISCSRSSRTSACSYLKDSIPNLALIFQPYNYTLHGSFSSASKPIVPLKYAFCRINIFYNSITAGERVLSNAAH